MSDNKPAGISFWLVLLSVFIGFCTFYAPQPLLPAFTEQLNLAPATSAWLLTIPFIALAFGPIMVGALLQHASARVLLGVVMFSLGIFLLAFAFAEQFEWKLLFRLLQSLLLPIIFTAGVTYASQAGEAQYRQRRVALYLSTSIVGGFSGRLLSGFIADGFGLDAPFMLFGVLAILSALSITCFVRDVPLQTARLGVKEILKVLGGKPVRLGLLVVFCTFFTYSGMLTALPFRLVDIDPGISSATISLVYLGYAVGIFIPVTLDRLISSGFGERQALLIGALLLCTGLAGMSVPNTYVIMAFFLVLSSGMFTLHATAAGWLNKIRSGHAGVVNGAYISNYYSAAAVASIIPLWLIQVFGWSAYIVSQLIIACSAFWSIQRLSESIQAEQTNNEAD